MSQPWMKFYPRDWRGDQALRVVSLAARGLWMEMLCVMHEGSPYGHLTVGNQPVSDAALARLVGTNVEEIQALLVELGAAGVFRRTRGGVVYSKRMIADDKRSKQGRKAKLEAIESAKENPGPSRVPASPPTTQKPEARSQKPELSPTTTNAGATDWVARLEEAKRAAGEMADLTSTAMHHAADLRALAEPKSGEPCTWDEVLTAITMTAMRQRPKRKLIRAWSWVKDDAFALRDKRLNAAAPAVAEVIPLRTGAVDLADREAARKADALRMAFEMLDAKDGRKN